MDFTEKTLSSETKFAGRLITVKLDKVLRPDGKPASREVVEHAGGVCVAALTDEDELLLVRQFRYPLHSHLLELPAGKIDPGEDPLACGVRELREETGATAETVVPLCACYVSPGFCTEMIHVYAAQGLTFAPPKPDEGEFVEVLRVPFQKAVEMALSGEIQDGKTITGILALWAKRQAAERK